MTKRRRETSPTAEVADLYTVFVDTSLDTHLAMLISSSDTVSDFKKKVALEHVQCFPDMGEIQVHSVKVKRRSTFYHLSDFLLVWSAFHGVKKNWLLSVDASSVHTCQSIRNPPELVTSSGLKIGVTNTDDDCRGFRSDGNRNNILPLSLENGAAEKNTVSEVIAGPKVDKLVEKTRDSHRSIYSEEHIVGAESRPKKKLKLSHAKDASQNTSLGGCGPMFHPDNKDGMPAISDSIVKVSGVRNDQCDVEGALVSGGISPPTMAEKSNMDSQNMKASDGKKENDGFNSMLNHQHLSVVSIMVQDSSARLMDASGTGGDANTSGSRRKKKKVQKTEARVRDTTDIEHPDNKDGMPAISDSIVKVSGVRNDQCDVEGGLVSGGISPPTMAKKSNMDSQNMKASDGKKENDGFNSMLNHQHSSVVSIMVQDSSARLMDASGTGGYAYTSGIRRKKKKVQKTEARVRDTTDIEHIGEGERIEPSTDTHICDQMVEAKGFLLKNDHEVMMLSNRKASSQVDPGLALTEASLLQDAEKSNFSIVNSQKLLDSNGKREDNVLESKFDDEVDQDATTVQSGGACTNTPNLSTRLVDAGAGIGVIKTDGKKRRKKKVQVTAAEVLATRDAEQIGHGEMKKPHTETIISEEKEEEKGLSLEHDNEVILPSDSKAPDHADPDLALKEASIMRDADAVVELDTSSGIKKRKKKKRENKHIGTSIEDSGITAEIHNSIRGSLVSLPPSVDHIPEETGNEENVRLNEGKDVQVKLLDGSNHDASEKIQDVNISETDLEIMTRTEQTVVHVSAVIENVAENAKSSAGNCNAEFPPTETENTIIESNQADKDNGNTEHGDKKSKKKVKKKKYIAADVQENSPVKDQQVGTALLANKETSIDFKPEQEVRHVDSSQILALKSEEKVEKIHEQVVNTDDLVENPANGSDRINFKQYFVPGQLQNEVDSGLKVRKGTKSKRSLKKAKNNDLPSVNISTQQQNSFNSFENKKTENNYGKDSGRSKCDSTQNPDWDEISHHSFIRSSEAPEIKLKDSSPSELCEVAPQKPNGIVAAPMFQNKNPYLDKPSPRKKNLLAKSGAIFQDNSGESSGDENRITHSNFSTRSPSDTSSMSGDSSGESELSLNSTSKGSSGAKGKSTSKLERPASKDMTIEMILKSSRRFKKAKEAASQTESQPTNFAPPTLQQLS